MEKRVCRAVTDTGNRCRGKIADGDIYCRIHKTKEEIFDPMNKNSVFRKLMIDACKTEDNSKFILGIKKFLRESGVDPNYYPEYLLTNQGLISTRETLLYYAIQLYDPEIIKLMIAAGAKVHGDPLRYLIAALELCKDQTDDNTYFVNKIILDSCTRKKSEFRYKDYIESVVTFGNIKFLRYAIKKLNYKEYALKLAIDLALPEAIKCLIELGAKKIHPPSDKVPDIVEIFFEHLNCDLSEYIKILPLHIDDNNEHQISFYKLFTTSYFNSSKSQLSDDLKPGKPTNPGKHGKRTKSGKSGKDAQPIKFQDLIDKALYNASSKCNVTLMTYLLELGANPNTTDREYYIYDSLQACLKESNYTNPRFLNALTVILKSYKMCSKMASQINKQISEAFDYNSRERHIYNHNFQEMLKILNERIKFLITSNYLRDLDISIGLLETKVSEISDSRKRNKEAKLSELNSDINNLKSFHHQLSTLITY